MGDGDPQEGMTAEGIIPEAEPETAEVAFTNSLTPLAAPTGSFEVSKTVADEDAVVPEDTEFAFSWQCTAPSGDAIPEDGPGEFTLTDQETWDSPDLPDGTQCQVTEAFPEGIGDSHGWEVSYSFDGGEPQPGLSAGVEIDASEETSAVEVAYTNTAVEAPSDSSAFTVTKQLDDPDSAVPGDFEFEFSWRCETGGGLLIPEDEPGTFTLQADEIWSSEQVPQGSSCVVQESEPSEIEGVTWQTSTSVDGSDPAEGSTAYFTLPQSEGPVEVLVANTAELTDPPPDPTPTPTETPTEPTDPPTEPTPSPTEPTPTEPTPTEPTPTEPTPTDATPTGPTPTDPEPTDPGDTESPPPEPQPEPSQPGALPETGTSAGWPAATAAVALLLFGVSLLIFNQRRDRSRTN